MWWWRYYSIGRHTEGIEHGTQQETQAVRLLAMSLLSAVVFDEAKDMQQHPKPKAAPVTPHYNTRTDLTRNVSTP
jgi:hypothetical protein